MLIKLVEIFLDFIVHLGLIVCSLRSYRLDRLVERVHSRLRSGMLLIGLLFCNANFPVKQALGRARVTF